MGHRFRGQHPVRPGDRFADHTAAAAADRARSKGKLHPLSLLRLGITVFYYLALSSVQVAWLAVKPGPPPLSAVLRAHVAVKSDLVLALAVNIINLIPGSIVLEIDQTRRMLYVHVIDVGSDRAVEPVLQPDLRSGATAGVHVRARTRLEAVG